MKLTFKTLDQKTCIVEIDEKKTLKDLKEHLFAQPEIPIPPINQQIIYNGRILDKDSPLKDYIIDERKFLVVMRKPSLPLNPPKKPRIIKLHKRIVRAMDAPEPMTTSSRLISGKLGRTRAHSADLERRTLSGGQRKNGREKQMVSFTDYGDSNQKQKKGNKGDRRLFKFITMPDSKKIHSLYRKSNCADHKSINKQLSRNGRRKDQRKLKHVPIVKDCLFGRKFEHVSRGSDAFKTLQLLNRPAKTSEGILQDMRYLRNKLIEIPKENMQQRMQIIRDTTRKVLEFQEETKIINEKLKEMKLKKAANDQNKSNKKPNEKDKININIKSLRKVKTFSCHPIQPVSSANPTPNASTTTLKPDDVLTATTDSPETPAITTESPAPVGQSVLISQMDNNNAEPASPLPTYSSNNLKILENMGYTTTIARYALIAALDNVETAASYLQKGIPKEQLAKPIVGPEKTSDTSANPLSHLLLDPEFNKIRMKLRKNPERLMQIFNRLERLRPDIVETINRNRDTFVTLLNSDFPSEDCGDGSGVGNDDDKEVGVALQQENSQSSVGDTPQIDPILGGSDTEMNELQLTLGSLSEDEMAAVVRLMDLGVDHDAALNAYLLHEKDEEQAAKFLTQDSSNKDNTT